MTRRIVLLRHGRTAWNAVARVQGQTDVGLDDLGRDQATAAAPVLAALRPDLLWCSDLSRARQTVAPLATACGLVPTYDERLREIGLGEWEGRAREELVAASADDYDRFRHGHYDVVPGAETVAEVAARMAAALADLAAELSATSGPSGVAVAVSHGAAIRIAVGELLGWPEGVFRTLRGLHNCGWAELVERDEADPDGPDGPGWLLEAWHRQAPAAPTAGA